MRLTFVLLVAFKIASGSTENADTLVFEQVWPVCKDTTDCPFQDIDGARFVTDAVFVMDKSKGIPFKNCQSEQKLNLTKLSWMEEDLDFAWPNWPKKLFEHQSALEFEWKRYALCFMDYMEVNEVWGDEEEFFEQVVSWYTEFQFAEQLKRFHIIPGSTVYIDRLYHSLRSTTGKRGQPRIDCKVTKNRYGMVEVQWKKVALCFNMSTLEPVDCGNLYGGYRGSCPKFSNFRFPYPLPKVSEVIEANIQFNIIYQRESMVVIMLLILVICVIVYLNIK